MHFSARYKAGVQFYLLFIEQSIIFPLSSIYVYLCIPMLMPNTNPLFSVDFDYILTPKSASTLTWHVFFPEFS